MQEYKLRDTLFGIQFPFFVLRSPKTGFTLTEILLVSVVLSIIGLSVYSAFNNGIKIWRRVVRNVTQEDISIFFDRISNDLRNTLRYKDIQFEGNQERIAFPALIVSQEQNVFKTEVGRVTYYLEKDSVNRQQANYSQLYQNINPPDRKLVNNLETLSFQYYYYDSEMQSYYWENEWKEKESLPLAVKIKVEFYDNGIKNNLTRTVYIPVGQILASSEKK